MSDSMMNMMQRMEEIRSRIDEIRSLGKKKGLAASGASPGGGVAGVEGSTNSSAASSPEAAEFALLLQEAAGLLEGQSDEDGSSVSQSLLGPLLGLEDDDALSGMGLTGIDSVQALLNKTGAVAPAGKLDEGLLSRALEAYKKQNE